MRFRQSLTSRGQFQKILKRDRRGRSARGEEFSAKRSDRYGSEVKCAAAECLVECGVIGNRCRVRTCPSPGFLARPLQPFSKHQSKPFTHSQRKGRYYCTSLMLITILATIASSVSLAHSPTNGSAVLQIPTSRTLEKTTLLTCPREGTAAEVRSKEQRIMPGIHPE